MYLAGLRKGKHISCISYSKVLLFQPTEPKHSSPDAQGMATWYLLYSVEFTHELYNCLGIQMAKHPI